MKGKSVFWLVILLFVFVCVAPVAELNADHRGSGRHRHNPPPIVHSHHHHEDHQLDDNIYRPSRRFGCILHDEVRVE